MNGGNKKRERKVRSGRGGKEEGKEGRKSEKGKREEGKECRKCEWGKQAKTILIFSQQVWLIRSRHNFLGFPTGFLRPGLSQGEIT